MSLLRDAIVQAFGEHARFDGSQHPASVANCVVPRDRFSEAAKVMKKAYALLAAEWAADETALGRGYGVFACYRWWSEYLIVKTEVPSDDPWYPSLCRSFVPAF